ncbi:NO-inducible flavohemoprotein [Agrobacterium vitis]|uniref:nitric oxide dioxygenase n=1 Tax=Agrobacterium vitis TaxID=373 RepID=A0A6L6VHI1_AGRVI|nr:NO-inducible flavohemoprotein [Agrobacterium vitis]MUZ75283.1 NO-inducible flavohemoprotein [Agrobacterium vitis]
MAGTLSPQTIAVVKATAPVLAVHGAAITQTMYLKLFENPQIAALFNQANQKNGTQVNALAAAILAYARNIENLGALAPAVERIAQKHIGYAIQSDHYPYVANALLAAITEVLGEGATPDILSAWGEAYWFLADILKGREAAIRSDIMDIEGGWTDWRRFVVTDRRRESDIITSFVLKPEDGGKVVPHKSGQYLTLRFDEADLPGAKRNYSISSGPSADFYRITVKREPKGEASVFLHDHAEVGTVIECTPPAGDFFLSYKPARPVILLSGGVGLTPMVSMLETIAARHLDVPTYYVHGTTSRSTHALDAEVRELALRHGATNVTTFYDTVDDASSEHCGFITIDWLAANTPLADADVYLCGPRPFLHFFVRGLISAGVPSDRVHYEFFGPADEALVA